MIVVRHWILSGLSLDNVSLCPFPLSFLLIWIHKSQKEWKPPLQKRRRGEKYNVVHAIRTFFKTRRKKGRDFLYVDHFCIITPIMIAVIYLFCDKHSITHLINLNIFNLLTIPWSQNITIWQKENWGLEMLQILLEVPELGWQLKFRQIPIMIEQPKQWTSS